MSNAATVFGGAATTRLHVFLRSFGPGLLWAGSAIGVSQLVQSTRAGADAGFGLTGVILFALILKYPFFAFGPLAGLAALGLVAVTFLAGFLTQAG